MKVVLINSNTKRSPWPIPPIGLCYIATGAERAGHQVCFLDLTFSVDLAHDVRRSVAKENPDVVGVSIRNIDNNTWRESSFFLSKIKERIIEPIKETTSATLIIGGAAAGINPQEMLDFFDVDFLIQGDGEEAFINFLDALPRNFSKVAGLVYRTANGVIDNGFNRTENLDALARPQIYRWVDMKRYEALNGSIGIQTKRGCSLRCSYCAYPAIEGTAFRLRSAAKVVDEIEEIIANCGPRQIEIVDSTFNIPLKHAIQICDELIKRRIRVKLRAMSITPMNVTEELIKKMKKAGFVDIDCNPESISPITLASLGKSRNYSANKVEEAATLISGAKIPTMWFFLMGAPGETEDSITHTFRFIDRHIPRNHLCVIAAGVRINSKTPLAERAQKERVIQPDQNLLFPAFYDNPSMPKDKLLYLVNREVLRRANCIFLQEDKYRPDWLIKLLTSAYKAARIKRPIWQDEILLKRLSSAFGMAKFKQVKHDMQYKHVVSALELEHKS